jgi:hypothetical protein
VSSDPLRDRISASFDAQQMERQQRYLEAGRRYKEADAGTLRAIWKQHFLEYCRTVGEGDAWQKAQDARRRQEDAEAELQMRGLEPPFEDEDVQASVTLLTKKAEAAMNSLTPDELEEKNQEVLDNIDRLLGKSDSKN